MEQKSRDSIDGGIKRDEPDAGRGGRENKRPMRRRQIRDVTFSAQSIRYRLNGWPRNKAQKKPVAPAEKDANTMRANAIQSDYPPNKFVTTTPIAFSIHETQVT